MKLKKPTTTEEVIEEALILYDLKRAIKYALWRGQYGQSHLKTSYGTAAVKLLRQVTDELFALEKKLPRELHGFSDNEIEEHWWKERPEKLKEIRATNRP